MCTFVASYGPSNDPCHFRFRQFRHSSPFPPPFSLLIDVLIKYIGSLLGTIKENHLQQKVVNFSQVPNPKFYGVETR